jgi:hypothetical protein
VKEMDHRFVFEEMGLLVGMGRASEGVGGRTAEMRCWNRIKRGVENNLEITAKTFHTI